MCRFAAYLGAPTTLGHFLLEPDHSLYRQAIAPKELRYTTLNADGFGFGWYGEEDEPLLYTNPAPIWNDPNLGALARTLTSDLWMASVRSATVGNPVGHANTQPFKDMELLFNHNGLIENFHEQVMPAIAGELEPGIFATVRGNTESEFLFAWLRQILVEDGELSIDEAVRELLVRLDDLLDGATALLNLLVTEGERLYAVRHAVGDDCPSLYFTTDDELFPEAQLIASECMTDSGIWHPVPPHHLLIIDPEEPPELIEL
jgi:glutamine amidotransferase